MTASDPTTPEPHSTCPIRRCQDGREDDGWRMEKRGWREDGEGRMKEGGWRMEDGGWMMDGERREDGG
eukprot:3235538-Rhodomonas_salina.1